MLLIVNLHYETEFQPNKTSLKLVSTKLRNIIKIINQLKCYLCVLLINSSSSWKNLIYPPPFSFCLYCLRVKCQYVSSHFFTKQGNFVGISALYCWYFFKGMKKIFPLAPTQKKSRLSIHGTLTNELLKKITKRFNLQQVSPFKLISSFYRSLILLIKKTFSTK
jgi:hypothetical protein